MVRCAAISGPAPSADEGDRAGAVGEDGVRHRALQAIVVVVRRRAQLHRHHHRAMIRERAQVVVRLLQRDHRARAAGVAHVDALHGGLQRERR